MSHVIQVVLIAPFTFHSRRHTVRVDRSLVVTLTRCISLHRRSLSSHQVVHDRQRHLIIGHEIVHFCRFVLYRLHLLLVGRSSRTLLFIHETLAATRLSTCTFLGRFGLSDNFLL